MSKNKWIDNLLQGTGAYRQIDEEKKQTVIIHQQPGITKQDLREVMMELPAPIINVPADHVINEFYAKQRRNGLA